MTISSSSSCGGPAVAVMGPPRGVGATFVTICMRSGRLQVRPAGPGRAAGNPGSVGVMLLAEDLLLLVTDDTSGQLSAPAAQVDAGLGGANLVELVMMNKVDLSGQ